MTGHVQIDTAAVRALAADLAGAADGLADGAARSRALTVDPIERVQGTTDAAAEYEAGVAAVPALIAELSARTRYLADALREASDAIATRDTASARAVAETGSALP
ncbi:hypothetical protein [Williamsia deligens]|uniref:Excreted virulence factor EspC, type VII ESX diderm n=1 Tax=Williamsia deligens TaxID=321325 RepID=A0ABW3GDU2_9NOCA|nr:hypothetical protein [Williamsia deligens]MCP2192391.1 hypothetical protein [Williamsia deligens]